MMFCPGHPRAHPENTGFLVEVRIGLNKKALTIGVGDMVGLACKEHPWGVVMAITVTAKM